MFKSYVQRTFFSSKATRGYRRRSDISPNRLGHTLRSTLAGSSIARSRTASPHVLVEAELDEGVISHRCRNTGKRIAGFASRGLASEDIEAVVSFAVERIGFTYDLKNIVDLVRYLLPTPPVPVRFRRRMIALGAGSPTRAICSTLIAQAFLHPIPDFCLSKPTGDYATFKFQPLPRRCRWAIKTGVTVRPRRMQKAPDPVSLGQIRGSRRKLGEEAKPEWN